jgi:hypothetical protein
MSTPQPKTCLLVTSTTYARDVVNLLCLPEGLQYRFRYRSQWVSPEILGNPSVLKGMKAVIVYFYGSGPGEQEREFLPIREVEIEEVESLGDILYLRFKTGRFYEQVSRKSAPHPNPRSSIIENAMKPFLQAAYPFLSRYLVLDDLISFEPAQNELLSWSNLVQWICDLEPFERVSFLKVIRVVDQNGKQVDPTVLVSEGKFITRGYNLRGGATYQLELLQRTNDKLRLVQQFEIRLKAPESLVPIQNAVVVGRYDRLELTFLVKAQLNDLYSSIGIEADGEPAAWILKNPGGDVSVKVMSPNIRLSVRVSRISYVLPIGLISLGIIINPFATLLGKLGVLTISDLYLSSISALGLLLVAIGISVFRKAI